MKINAIELELIKKAKNILDTKLTESFTIKGLATIVGLHEAKLRRGFKMVYKEPIINYHLIQRMDYAQKLIESGTRIKEVAYHLGYKCPKSFSNLFKKIKGFAPEDVKWM